MKYRFALALSAMAMAPVAAHAQAAAPAQAAIPAVGATVNGSDGQPIGTVDSATSQAIVINTGTNKVPVPPTSVGKDAKGAWHMEMTKAQLDAAMQQAQAQSQAQTKAALVPGAEVHGTGGALLGTIKSTDAESVTLTTPKGDARLPLSAVGMGPNGLVAGITVDQLNAAIGSSAPAAAPGGSKK